MSGRPVAGATTLLLALLVALLARPTGAAGQLQAGPTLLEIGPQATSTGLILRNAGDTPVAAQVRVYAWSQPEGADLLVPSDDIAVSPPILEVPAGGEQVVRVVRLIPPVSGRDRSYRVVVDELPQAEGGGRGHVNLRLRYVIPAFLRAPGAPPPTVACRIAGGGTHLACENHGGRAARFGASRLLTDRGEVLVLSDGLFGYVLPGSHRAWVLPEVRPELHGPALQLETSLNGQPATLEVDRIP